jgi:Zn-dependent protease
MGDSIRLGRILGIPIGINWSWILVFGLIVWSLATGVFPATNPFLSDATYYAMAVVAALLFFVSILLHELGHAAQAQRDGMRIEGITLWLFGGVAKFRGMFPSAWSELRIALAGPAVSAALAGLLLGLAWVVSLPDAADGVVVWLGYINLVLLVFNLLPALPLDGGRVLRSLLWAWRGDLAWATRIAATAGQGFGYLLIAGGIVLAIVYRSFSGAWFAVIGWFLLSAATAEGRQAPTQARLSGRRVSELMTREPVVAYDDESIGMLVGRAGRLPRYVAYPVVDRDGRAVGLLPSGAAEQVSRFEWDRHRVADLMIPAHLVPAVAPDDDALGALADISASPARR